MQVQSLGPGRSPGEGNGNLLQYACLENPMDKGVWRATVHGLAKSRTRLGAHTHTPGCSYLYLGLATSFGLIWVRHVGVTERKPV